MPYTQLIKTVKHEVRENLSLSVPLISAQLIYAISSFVATAMIAHLGEDALAACVLVAMVWASLSMLFFGILNSISVLVSHQYGAKDYLAISRIMGQSFWIGAILSILLAITLYLMTYCMHWSHQPAHVLALADDYLYSLIWTIPSLVILIVIEQFLAGISRAKLVLRISLLVVPLEVPIIYAFIYGKCGLPAFGVAGIGYGFATSYTLSAIFLIWYLMKSKQYKHFHIFSRITEWHLNYFKELMRVGLPMGFMHVVEISALAIITFWIAQFGTTMLAAHQIVIQYLSFLITMVFAMSQAVTIRVGQGVGKNDEASIRFSTYVGMGLSTFIMLLIMMAFTLFPDFFIRIDINTHKAANLLLVQEASSLLTICGILLVFDNLRLVGFGALRGLKDTRFPMYASLFTFWLIGLSSAYVLGFHYHLSAKGVWYGLLVGVILGFIVVSLRIHHIFKRIDMKKILHIQ